MNQTPPKQQPQVACFGEILWDSMPHGLFIGGAPYNVAYHLARLDQPTLLVSAVGSDELGKLALEKAKDSGVDVSCIQISDIYPTGIADIFINQDNDADYDIRKPAAWDFVELTQLVEEKVANCTALVFGTLASRSSVTRATLFSLLEGFKGLTVCDVNLRKPYDDRDLVLSIASKAQVVKLNEDELYTLSQLNSDTTSLEQALNTFKDLVGAQMIFLTRGKDPAVYFDGTRMIFASPPDRGDVADTVGAGDAFTAAIIQSMLYQNDVETSLDRGVRLGAYVATQHGAQPIYEPEAAMA
ncbi:carbohydrate kinase [Pelagicoccus sp. SDUM812003]|uniref:carbohydrate kinase family protein n=1 Tax=Pelagicoccus sp. SDUM812003 TaxID=3041267 RepID=UPI00280CB3D7|nr:carbohydrate kinase [Pelagicoccus sp. SDUM812003]MDQ8204646.1 carbohydrate kinase [Pelagicoccus sp. SDUM812003]